MKKYIFLFALAFIGYSSYAQIGIGTKTPDESSALDVKLPNKGVLLSRVSLTSTTDVTTIPSAANSLTVYNTATAGDVMPGYYYWNTAVSKWIRLMDSNSEGWGLKGNSETNSATHFIGTTDDKDIIFKRNKVQIGRLAQTNISFGEQALQNVTAGIENVGIGANALNRNSSGNSNTALGHHALKSNSTSFNTGVGSMALSSVVTGDSNTAVGSNSSLNIVKGRMNTSVGYNSLYSGEVGSKNTASLNTAIGSYAAFNTTYGDLNTAIGYDALYNNNYGVSNTALGMKSLSDLKAVAAGTSDSNVAVGSNAGTMLTSGNKNIFLGADTKPTNTVGSNQLNIGNSIYGVNINRSGVNASIGINVPAPDNSAVLELSATNKGFLPPRISLKSTTDDTTITNPATGLLVYNTATVGTGIATVTPGYYYWNGAKWNILASSDNVWSTSGNSGTSSGTNFIGTTDDNDLIFKRNGIQSGRLTKSNTSFGEGSLLNPVGLYNTAIGKTALALNTSGAGNTAIGFETMQKNTEGSSNSAFGYRALYNFTKGTYNVGVGMRALLELKNGANNVALGSNALGSTTTGNYNIAIGSGAGYNLNTLDNSDGFNIIIGSNNELTNQGLQNGKNNTILGSRITQLSSSLSNNIIIADGEGNRRINVNELGNVGLGTNAPHESAALDITSTNKGLLLPRVALTATNVATPLSTVTAGMTVYNTATAGVAPNNVTPGVYYHTGSEWIKSSGDNLGNHTAYQVLNLANNNITNAKKTDTELLTIKKGADGSLPTNGKLAMAANAQGDIVWVDPDKLPSSIPAPSAIFKINTNQDILGGSIGSTSVMKAKLLASSIKSKVSFDESTSKIKLKPGKYKIELALSLLAPDSPSGTNVHSYFVDFPGQGGRIHQNQVAMGGTISNHGINISSIAIISNDTDWTIYLGRGQAGNYVGKTLIEGNDTSNGNYILITQLPD